MAEYLIWGALIFIGIALHRIADALYDESHSVCLVSYSINRLTRDPTDEVLEYE